MGVIKGDTRSLDHSSYEQGHGKAVAVVVGFSTGLSFMEFGSLSSVEGMIWIPWFQDQGSACTFFQGLGFSGLGDVGVCGCSLVGSRMTCMLANLPSVHFRRDGAFLSV